MMRLLWLLAWCSHAKIDTKTWTVTIDEELPVGRNIVDLRHELNYSPERIFSLMSASDMFTVSPNGVLSTKGRVDFESICVNSRDVCTVELEVGVLPQEYYERIQLTLLITNKNDNLHYFTQPQYELSISGIRLISLKNWFRNLHSLYSQFLPYLVRAVALTPHYFCVFTWNFVFLNR